MNCQSNSVLAATLANNGTCPITGDKILNSEAVQHVRSLMYSCGMAIYSGQFAFNVSTNDIYRILTANKKIFSIEIISIFIEKS